jgi:hypothetical protein
MQILIYIRVLILMNTHTYPTSINTFERLSRLDLEIHEVDHKKRLAIDEDAISQ